MLFRGRERKVRQAQEENYMGELQKIDRVKERQR